VGSGLPLDEQEWESGSFDYRLSQVTLAQTESEKDMVFKIKHNIIGNYLTIATN
jgi:hypothetical protein